MDFCDFTLPKVREAFQLSIETMERLITDIAPVEVSGTIRNYLNEFKALGVNMPTDKGRTEFLVAPILAEVWRKARPRVSLYSGFEFNVDDAAGLSGVCDFLLGLSSQPYFVEAPILAVVEAKRDSIDNTFGPCAARMMAVQRFNQNANKMRTIPRRPSTVA